VAKEVGVVMGRGAFLLRRLPHRTARRGAAEAGDEIRRLIP